MIEDKLTKCEKKIPIPNLFFSGRGLPLPPNYAM
jgi:hypothetical protein